MAVVQCENGHYYDNMKFEKCPHCDPGIKHPHTEYTTPALTVEHNYGASKGSLTFDKDFENALNEQVTKTVSLFMKNGNSNPIAGWLVCIKGENKGKSFELHLGKNFIGRSMRSDVVISDPQVSRENHFSIVYDPSSHCFYALTGVSMVYYNQKLLEKPVLLAENDVLEIGTSSFAFIPYCKEGRDWDE